ncbi:MAG TPA: helix-turn-helix domain-containing protein [Gemmataceae bacterium]|nr:helix-turn-helix domain-containing protein [Gemmataceae bacterium]
MPSGRKPNLERRRQVLRLRDRGLSLNDIARRFGVTKQAVWSLLNHRPQRTTSRAVPCSACGEMIVSPGALRRDADAALCLDCLRAQPGAPFALRLKALRLAAGLSRAELAQQSGVAPGSLRAYEDGRRKPHQRSATRVAAVLGEELLGAARRKGAKKQFSDAS